VDMPINAFKRALKQGVSQIGLWMGMADAYVAELLATAGFDWICIDGEHAPNDVRIVLAQLQAMAPYPTRVVVRPVAGNVALIKQYLDIGAQTLLIPMVETAEQAAQMVAATRYPPGGIRGVGSALARASRWNQIDGYLQRCDAEMCVLVQVESMNGLQNLESIAAVDGVDGVFFGPADLSASMGLLGKSMDSSVQRAILEGIARVRKTGKAAGMLSGDRKFAQDCLNAGAAFVAVGVDTTVLVKAAGELAQSFRGTAHTATAQGPRADSTY
jgi:4-hydroxy-2-oxoheptanedioate aldolase